MLKKMKYSLYKNYYWKYPASDYDKSDKTIMVDLPDVKQAKFPKEWKRDCNHYLTPSGIRVYFYNTGLAQNYQIEISNPGFGFSYFTVGPGVNSRQKAIERVKQLEQGIYNPDAAS